MACCFADARRAQRRNGHRLCEPRPKAVTFAPMPEIIPCAPITWLKVDAQLQITWLNADAPIDCEQADEDEVVSRARLVYCLGSDDFHTMAQLPSEALVMYHGSHGDRVARRADVVLPGCYQTWLHDAYSDIHNANADFANANCATTPISDSSACAAI